MRVTKRRKLRPQAVVVLILIPALIIGVAILLLSNRKSKYPSEMVNVNTDNKEVGSHETIKEAIGNTLIVAHYPNTKSDKFNDWIHESMQAQTTKYKEAFADSEEEHQVLIDYESSRTFDRYESVNLLTYVDKILVHTTSRLYDTEKDDFIDTSILKNYAIRLVTAEIRKEVPANTLRDEYMKQTLIDKEHRDLYLKEGTLSIIHNKKSIILNLKEHPEYLNEAIGTITPSDTPIDSVYLGEGANPSDKLVALTFDDGPHHKNTPQVLDILEKHNAKGTFFMLGNRIKQNPTIVKDMIDRGHQAANHSYSHPKTFSTIGIDKVKEEINKTNEEIFKATGYKENFFVRPPYGAFTDEVLANSGSVFINWSVDTEDWLSRNPKKICEVTNRDVKDGSIILVHDIHITTVESLDCMLSTLTAKGYKFVTVRELLEAKGHEIKPGSYYRHG